MQRFFLLPVLAGLFAASAQAAPPSPIEVPLQFLRRPARRKGKPPARRVFIPPGIRYLDKGLQPPPGEWKLPEFKSDAPVYSLLTLAGRKYLLVLDKKDEKSPFYDRLYLDADGNGDLTDDPPVDAPASPRRGPYLFADFPSIDLEIPLPGGKAPYAFTVRAYRRPLPSTAGKRPTRQQWLMRMNVYMTPDCAYAGRMELQGKTYRILMADTNGDGRFGSKEKVLIGFGRKRADLVYISGTGKINYQDGMEAQGLLGLGDRLFRLRFRRIEGKLLLDPLPEAAARLRLPMKVTRLVLAPAGRSAGILWFDPGGEIALPAGAYRLGSYQALREDDGGNEWILLAAGAKDGPALTAKAGKTLTLRFGEPFVPRVGVYARFPKLLWSRSVAARLSFTLLGAGGERVTDIRSMTYKKSAVPRSSRSRYRPLEPTYKILELPSLRVAAQGSFHYG